MAEFILVHGGLHGAWCWELLETELGRLGHKTHAMDLPIDRQNVYVDDYARTVLSAVAGKAADDAFLVGHSMGGLIVPRVAFERPAARIVFLCAGFAHTSEAERLENQAAIDANLFFTSLMTDALGRVTMTRESATEVFYHDVPPELADWAAGKLRPQWAEGYANVGPIAPYAERVAGIIACADDRIVLPEPHARIARARFGIAPVMLPGGHSPFLSRPADLARVLDEIAATDRS
jgi:pimeloyl-ACP methyl ester carboxylesterase